VAEMAEIQCALQHGVVLNAAGFKSVTLAFGPNEVDDAFVDAWLHEHSRTSPLIKNRVIVVTDAGAPVANRSMGNVAADAAVTSTLTAPRAETKEPEPAGLGRTKTGA
jgi:hypothetical protein